MVWFFISAAVFLGGHIVPGLLRDRIVNRVGHTGYVIGFSILSTGLFGWVIYEVLHAESLLLWDYRPWQAKLLIVVMLPTCILWACAILQPCPLSIGRKTGFDPKQPGINRFCRHPLLLGVFLWGIGHVIANGDLVSVLFFGGSAVFALIGFPRMEKMRLRDIPKSQHQTILSGTRRFSPSGLLKGAIGFRDIVLGLLAYSIILVGHEPIIGINPLEMAGW